MSDSPAELPVDPAAATDGPAYPPLEKYGLRLLARRWPYPQHAGKWLILWELPYEAAGYLFEELVAATDPSLESFADRLFQHHWNDGEYTNEKGMRFLIRILDTFRWQGLLE